MYRKHSIEERLQAVQKCLEGYAPNDVGRQMQLNPHLIREWLLRYQQEGESGLRKRSCFRANFEEKCKIVCEYAEKGVPLHRVSVKYHVSQSAISRWAKLYREGGYEALRIVKKQGRPCKNDDMGRPKKQEPQTELEKLRYENEYLRAENALLKKVRALMEEREKRLHEIGRKPSKH